MLQLLRSLTRSLTTDHWRICTSSDTQIKFYRLHLHVYTTRGFHLSFCYKSTLTFLTISLVVMNSWYSWKLLKVGITTNNLPQHNPVMTICNLYLFWWCWIWKHTQTFLKKILLTISENRIDGHCIALVKKVSHIHA